MKILTKLLLAFSFLLIPATVFSQNTAKVKELIDQGVALNDSGKYAEAIAKYQEAIKIDNTSLRAQYELSYTLSISGRPKDAIPYLEKVAASNTFPEAYDLLANIYDDDNNFEKSVAYYKQGLIAFPQYQRLHFNLAISYLRQKKYEDAETAAIDAIKLNPKHASSQRVYALATYSQNKFAPSVMAFCSFLLLEPQSKRSAEAYGYIQKIFQSRVRVDADSGSKKSMTIYVQDNKSTDEDELALEALLSTAAATPILDKNKNRTPNELLSDQLETIFKGGGELSAKRKNKNFFWKYYADYFYLLAQTDNMPAFARLVSLSAYQKENLQWFKENDSKLKALDHWVSTTDRNF